MTSLKPCPFCGGEAHTIEPARYGKRWGVRCECGAFIGFKDTEAEAIKAWNTRCGGRMIEYIITDEQLKTATEAYLEHELSRPITEVFISGDKLPEIVRCRDCKYCMTYMAGTYCDYMAHVIELDGFCAWGEFCGAKVVD